MKGARINTGSRPGFKGRRDFSSNLLMHRALGSAPSSVAESHERDRTSFRVRRIPKHGAPPRRALFWRGHPRQVTQGQESRARALGMGLSAAASSASKTCARVETAGSTRPLGFLASPLIIMAPEIAPHKTFFIVWLRFW